MGKWNLSSVLSRAQGKAVKLRAGWILTDDGMDCVRALDPSPRPPALEQVESNLRSLIAAVDNADVRQFLTEATICLQSQCHRAAVVLSWVGAMATLQHHVLTYRLADFNTEAVRRNGRWVVATTADDLSRMKERDFLDILESLSVLGPSVKRELVKCLELRNACGHPNSMQVGSNAVAAHIETLILNVYEKFQNAHRV